MTRALRIADIALVLGLLAAGEGAGQVSDDPDHDARQLTVMTSGGFAAAYAVLGPRFEQATGIALVTVRGASSGGAPTSIPVRLSRGEPADVIILSRSSLDQLTEQGRVRPNSRVDLVRSTIGMAVRNGAEVPDISSPEAFIEAVLRAESIGYSASASGTYLSTELFPRLGIWERIEPKAKRVVGEPVASVVARGEVEVGFQQISEILPVDGAVLVGPLPSDLQRVTTFSAAVTESSLSPMAAQALVEFLASESVAGEIANTGLDPVVWEQTR